jgi:hypothetical protein
MLKGYIIKDYANEVGAKMYYALKLLWCTYIKWLNRIEKVIVPVVIVNFWGDRVIQM